MSLEPAMPEDNTARNMTEQRNGSRPLSNAQRKKAQAATTGTSAKPRKPRKPRPGGHKPDGSERYQEAKRQAEAELANRPPVPQPTKAPVPYSDEIAEIILERLEQGESLKSICSTDDMPTESAVRKWASDEEAERTGNFGARYVRARSQGWLVLADQLEDFASGADLGERRFEPGVVQRHRLQVDTRRWLLSKMLPKVFGDKIDVTSDGERLQQQAGANAAIKALIDALPALTAGALPAPEPIEAESVPVTPEGEQ